MKGCFLEKSRKNNNKIENRSKNEIVFTPTQSQSKKIIAVIKNDTIPDLKKEDILKNLYLGEIVAKNKEVIIKNKKAIETSSASNRFYFKHNTFQADTALYSSITNGAPAIKQSLSMPAALNKRAGKSASPKKVNESEGSDFLLVMGTLILAVLVISGLVYFPETVIMIGSIILFLGTVALFIYICVCIGKFLESMIPG